MKKQKVRLYTSEILIARKTDPKGGILYYCGRKDTGPFTVMGRSQKDIWLIDLNKARPVSYGYDFVLNKNFQYGTKIDLIKVKETWDSLLNKTTIELI